MQCPERLLVPSGEEVAEKPAKKKRRKSAEAEAAAAAAPAPPSEADIAASWRLRTQVLAACTLCCTSSRLRTEHRDLQQCPEDCAIPARHLRCLDPFTVELTASLVSLTNDES